MRKPEAVGNRPHLQRDLQAVDLAVPDRIAWFPGRSQLVRLARRAIGVDKVDHEIVGLARDLKRDFLAIEPHRAAAFALHGPPDHLAGNLPLAFAEHVIDGGGDRGQPPRDLAFRRTRRQIRAEIPRR